MIRQTKKSLPTRGLLSTTDLWLQQKAARDSHLWKNPDNLWIFQNKLYDLTSYVSLHPGGDKWITYTRGQDITEYFVLHHLDQAKARAVLEEYFVGQCGEKQEPRYTFDQDGLYRKIKRRLLQKYNKKQLQNSQDSKSNALQYILIWSFLFLLTSYTKSYTLAIILGLLLYPITGIAHNFVHMKNNPFRYLYMFTGFSHQEWQKMHCLSHHTYTNTLLDYQLGAIEPLAYFVDYYPKNTYFGFFMKEALYLFSIPSNILLKTVIAPLRKSKKPQWPYLVCLSQLILLYLLTSDFITSLKLFLTIHMTFGYFFFKMILYSHRSDENWTQGNKEIRDYAEHIIQASTDFQCSKYCESGFLSYLFFSGFNMHVVHHLFPTIDNHHLPKVNDILKEQADKMKIKRNVITNIVKGMISTQKRYLRLIAKDKRQ